MTLQTRHSGPDASHGIASKATTSLAADTGTNIRVLADALEGIETLVITFDGNAHPRIEARTADGAPVSLPLNTVLWRVSEWRSLGWQQATRPRAVRDAIRDLGRDCLDLSVPQWRDARPAIAAVILSRGADAEIRIARGARDISTSRNPAFRLPDRRGAPAGPNASLAGM